MPLLSEAKFMPVEYLRNQRHQKIVEEIAGEYENNIKVGKLNVDDNPSTATKYGIRGIPTLLFFKGGQVVQQVTGVKSKAEIKKIIDESLV